MPSSAATAPEPPTVVSIIEIEGARIHMQIANCRPDDVKLGMPVDFTFRRIHEVGHRPNYYWKAVPREAEDVGDELADRDGRRAHLRIIK